MIADLNFFFFTENCQLLVGASAGGGNVRQKNRRGKEKGEGEEGERE